MEFTKALMIIAIVAVAVSAVNVYRTVEILTTTGFAQTEDTGTADVEIVTEINIMFTEAVINWGQGAVNRLPVTFATLYTEQTGGFYVVDGTWADVAPDSLVAGNGLLLENQGNVNVELSLETDKNPKEFICPSQLAAPLDCTVGSPIAVDAEFNWKLSDGPSSTGTCSGVLSDTAYAEVCKSGEACDVATFGRVVCTVFESAASVPNNVLAIDLQLIIPSDADPMAASSQTILTAHAEAV